MSAQEDSIYQRQDSQTKNFEKELFWLSDLEFCTQTVLVPPCKCSQESKSSSPAWQALRSNTSKDLT